MVALLAICALPVVAWALILRAHFGYPDDPPTSPCRCRRCRASCASCGTPGAQAASRARSTRSGRARDRHPGGLHAGAPAAAAAVVADRDHVRAAGVCLGPAWEGFPSSSSRVLLPLTLAFNVLVPRTRPGWCAAGRRNLSAALGDLFQWPARAPESAARRRGERQLSNRLVQPRDPRLATAGGGHPAHPLVVRLRNAGASDRSVTLEFELGSVTERTVTIRAGGVSDQASLRRRATDRGARGPVHAPARTTPRDFAARTDLGRPWPEAGGA